jgi:RNase P subunit RPR2
MTDVHEVLMWNGITPPAEGWRTTCPLCSPHRKRKNHKVLKFWQNGKSVMWKCSHCDWEGGDA